MSDEEYPFLDDGGTPMSPSESRWFIAEELRHEAVLSCRIDAGLDAATDDGSTPS